MRISGIRRSDIVFDSDIAYGSDIVFDSDICPAGKLWILTLTLTTVKI